jgi:sugar lactone lactonase YvrE
MPLLRLLGRAARVGAGVAALGLGLLLLVAGINGVPRLVDRLEGGPRIIGVVRPPEPSPNPASPSPAALPSSPPGVPLPVQFLWEADGDDERLQGVRALAVDAEGNAYVQDAFHHQIVKFDPDGRVLTRWGREGDGPGQFNFLRANGTQGYPGAIAVAPDGTIYVADDNGRIQQFDPDGHYLGEWANKRGGPGRLEYAGSMTFDQQGHIWMNGGVAGSFIQKFGRDGTLLASWGDSGTGPDEWNQPGAFAFASDGTLYVSDSGNHRVKHVDAAGRTLSLFGGAGDGPGQFNLATGLAMDAEGNIYVGDNRGHRVQKFDAAGAYLGEFGERGTRPGQFNRVGQIALDGQGNIYVADQVNSRIQKFRLP